MGDILSDRVKCIEMFITHRSTDENRKTTWSAEPLSRVLGFIMHPLAGGELGETDNTDVTNLCNCFLLAGAASSSPSALNEDTDQSETSITHYERSQTVHN